MANTTDKSILTAAGKALLAQLNAEEKPLIIDKMIFANVPNRPEFPQPDDVVPNDSIVHQEGVEQRGRLSADSVIYSTTLTSDVGPFEFNWTGAYCSEYGVLVTVDHHALTPKTADEPGVAGNTLVRSVVLEYKDIAEITNITVDASTWQYNANERLKKMDTDVAQAIIDQNGKDWFIEDGFLVTPQGSAFNIKAGAGYVSGNRVTLDFDRNVQVPNKPSFIYVDAHREGTPNGEQVTLFDFVVTAEEKDDYTDTNGVKHLVCKIAQVLADGTVVDLRDESAYFSTATTKTLKQSLWPKGATVETKGYSKIGDGGGAKYLVCSESEFVNQFGEPDGLGDHLLAGNMIAMLILQESNYIRCWGTGQGHDTASVRAALKTVKERQGYGLISNYGNEIEIAETIEMEVGPVLKGGKARAVGYYWINNTADVDTETKGKPMFSFIEEKFYSGIEDMKIDCGLTTIDPVKQDIAAAGIWSDGARNLQNKQLRISHFNGYGILTVRKNTDATWDDITAQQWMWGERGHTDISLRTAVSIGVHTADGHWNKIVAQYSRIPLDVDNFWNAQFSSIHVYNGSTEPVNLPVIRIGENCHGTVWSNVYIDNGYVELHSFDHVFSVLKITKTGNSSMTHPFHLVAHQPDETAAGLVLKSGTSAFENLFKYRAEGDGSWSKQKKHISSSIVSSRGKFGEEFPYLNNMVSAIGHNLFSNNGKKYEGICNRAPQYQIHVDHYSCGYHAAVFHDADNFYPAFRGAKSRSDDYSARPLSGNILTEFWGTGSTGSDFGTPDTPYQGGGGMRVIAENDWAWDDYATRLSFFGTRNGQTNPTAFWSMRPGALVPGLDNVFDIGDPYLRPKQIFAMDSNISTSDGREKQWESEEEQSTVDGGFFEGIPNIVLDAFSKVPKRRFKWKSAIEREQQGGKPARWHIGVIAQDIVEVFSAHGLDATEYAVLCYDQWPEKVINHPAVYEPVMLDDGTVEQEQVIENGQPVFKSVELEGELTQVPVTKDKFVLVQEAREEVIPAGDRYGVRYDEAAQLDAAISRRDIARIKDQLGI